jgi:hypothetical protein
MYSGCLMKRKWTKALSPVRKHSWDIFWIWAVCRKLPQWTANIYIKKKNSYNTQTHNACLLFFIPIAWYRVLIVVGWWRTRISPSNSQDAVGLSSGDTKTIPFLICDLLIYEKLYTYFFPEDNSHKKSENWCQTFLRANEAVWPPRTSLTGIRLRCMLLIAIGINCPTGSGPRSS